MTQPAVALVLSAGLAVLSMWVGLTISYRAGDVPASFAITATLTVAYLAATLWSRLR